MFLISWESIYSNSLSDNIYEILPNEIKIIEDSCEALGGEYKNQKLGTFGDAGAFAFTLINK